MVTTVKTMPSADASWNSRSFGYRAALFAWNEILSHESVPVSVESSTDNFTMDWRRFGLGGVELSVYSCGPVQVHRSREMIQRGGEARMILVHARRGVIDIVHGHGRYHVVDGGFALVDETTEYRLSMLTGGECLTIRAPESWMAASFIDLSSALCEPVADTRGSRPLAALLSTMADAQTIDLGLPREAMADQIARLITIMCHAGPSAKAPGSKLAGAILRAIENRFDDPFLTPDKIARQIGISRRHLHRVLADSGETYSRHLIDRRITEAKNMLQRSENRLQISEVAWRCGFADSSHFARLFRSHTGLSPSSYREARH